MATPAGEAVVRVLSDRKHFEDGMKKVEARLKQLGRNISKIGMGMAKAGASIVAPLVMASNIWMKFEDNMASVGTMLGKNIGMLGDMSTAVRAMSVEMGEGTETLSKGLYDILSAGVDAAHALDVLAVSAMAARAGVSDTGTAADAITTILNAFSLEANQAGDVADWFFAVIRKGKTTFPELAAGIGNVASIAASANVELDELGAMLATLTASGVKTDVAITSLRSIISAFLKPTTDAAAAAKEYGFELSSATLRTLKLSGVMQKLAGLSPDAIAKIFPNIKAMSGVLPALNNMGKHMENLAAMEDRAGAAAEAFAIKMNTLAAAWDKAKASLIDVATEVGKSLGPILSDLADWFTETLPSIREWIEQNKGLVITLFQTGAAMLSVATALVVVGGGIKVLTIAWGGLQVVMTLVAAHPVGATLVALTAIVLGVSMAMGGLTVAMAKTSSKMKEALAAGDAQRAAHQKMFARLKDLAAIEEKSNAEKLEAKKIIDDLTAAYGDLGIQIDDTSGAITNLDSAFAKMSQQMRKAAIAQVEAAMAEIEANMFAREQEIRERWGKKQTVLQWATGTGEDQEGKIAVLRKLNAADRKAISAMSDRLTAIESGNIVARAPAAEPAAVAVPKKPVAFFGVNPLTAPWVGEVVKRRADQIQALRDRLARANLEADLKGDALEKALLKQEEAQEMRGLGGAGDDVRKLLMQIYAARRAAIGEDAPTVTNFARGIISAAAAQSLRGAGAGADPAARAALAAEENAKQAKKNGDILRQTRDAIDEMVGLARDSKITFG